MKMTGTIDVVEVSPDLVKTDRKDHEVLLVESHAEQHGIINLIYCGDIISVRGIELLAAAKHVLRGKAEGGFGRNK